MTWRFFVNELLQYGRVKQGKTANEETGVDTFDRRVVDTRRPQGRVDDVVEEWDHHDDGDRIDVSTRMKDVSRVLTRWAPDCPRPKRER